MNKVKVWIASLSIAALVFGVVVWRLWIFFEAVLNIAVA